MATLAERNAAKKRAARVAAQKEKARKRAENVEAMHAERKRIRDAANARQSKKLADKRAADRKKVADKRKSDKKKKDTKKKDTKKATKKVVKTAAKERDKDRDTGGRDTAERRSPPEYRPNVPIAKGGDDVFFGTNIPTKGYSSSQIEDFNSRLRSDIGEGNMRGANDVIFSIAYAKGGGQGNERVGAVQSGMYKLDNGPLWAEGQINSTNDRYVIRDASGKPTGQEVRYDDASGVVKGNEGNWTSIGSWGGNAKAGIVEGQPTAKPPPSGLRSIGIQDLDEGRMMATGQAGGRTRSDVFSPGGRIPAGAGTTGGGGLLGGQYGGRVGEYQVPNRSFNWQTDPTEQALMASAMGRPDLAQMMLTGQYGPLAGQNYQYGGGQTRINYGGAGAGAGAGLGGAGVGGTGGRLGPLGGAGAGAGAGAGTGAGPVIPAAGGGGGLSLGGLGGLLGGLGRPTRGGGRVQGGNVQSVADINAQEIAAGGGNVDQFAVNQMALPSLLSGRAALPSASWTAPANPYGTQPGGYTTGAVADFRNLVANTPMGTANQGVDFATLPPPPVGRVDPNIALNAANAAAHARSQAAAAQAASQAMAASAANPFDFGMGNANLRITGAGGPPRI